MGRYSPRIVGTNKRMNESRSSFISSPCIFVISYKYIRMSTFLFLSFWIEKEIVKIHVFFYSYFQVETSFVRWNIYKSKKKNGRCDAIRPSCVNLLTLFFVFCFLSEFFLISSFPLCPYREREKEDKDEVHNRPPTTFAKFIFPLLLQIRCLLVVVEIALPQSPSV